MDFNENVFVAWDKKGKNKWLLFFSERWLRETWSGDTYLSKCLTMSSYAARQFSQMPDLWWMITINGNSSEVQLAKVTSRSPPSPEYSDSSSLLHRVVACVAAYQDSSSVHRVPFAWTACDWDALAARCSRWPVTEIYPNVKYLRTGKKLIDFVLKHIFRVAKNSRELMNRWNGKINKNFSYIPKVPGTIFRHKTNLSFSPSQITASQMCCTYVWFA
jgi:hypothetical protein